MIPATAESLRKSVHVGMSGFALLLRWIPWWAAALLALSAMVFNATGFRKLAGGRLLRDGEKDRRLSSGVFYYALSILVLILVFRRHLEIVACAWGIMALGDGAATLAGRNLGGARLPWNREKRWMGLLAFLVFGTAGGGALMAWVARGRAADRPLTQIFLIAGLTSLLAGIVESLPILLDDNLSVPFLSAGLIFSLQLVEPSRWTQTGPTLGQNLVTGAAASLLLALIARAAGAVSWSGVIAGMGVGTAIATFAGSAGFVVLVVFFLLGSGATRLGYRGKAARGIAQERGGARGAVHAVANCAVAAYLAFLGASTSSPLSDGLRVAFVASLATAACDTLGSEIGPLAGGMPILITRMRRVAAGTPGAVSILGTAAGVLGALAVGGVAAGLKLIPLSALGWVVLAALAGTLVESVLGATLERKGGIDSETMNLVNTLVGALVALGLFRIWGGSR